MSVVGDKVLCDRCGADLGNGNIYNCIFVADLEPEDENKVRNLHFCRDQKDEDGKVMYKGCTNYLLSASNMAHYNNERKDDGKPKQATATKKKAKPGSGA